MTIAGGAWIFLAVCVVFLFGVIYGFYTEKGSGISERPYGKVYGGAPGALGPSSVSGRDSREKLANWTRGTK